jgi:hypothetical protein
MSQEIEPVKPAVSTEPVDMAGLTPLQKALRRSRRCRLEFTQTGAKHRCFLADGHSGYHCVNEWGVLYWAHPLQKFGQSTEEFMAQIARGEAVMRRAAGQTEEDMRGLPHLEMAWSVPVGVPETHSPSASREVLVAMRERLTQLESDVRNLENSGRFD